MMGRPFDLYIISVFSFSICFGAERLFATYNTLFNDHYKASNSVGNFTSRSLLDCHSKCIDRLECLSFFYNNILKLCILHSSSFQYTTTAELDSEIGWRFYLTSDTTSRCPSDNGFLYNRNLDLCYNLNSPMPIDFLVVNDLCQSFGGELIRIDSDNRQKYVEFITENEPTERICIQGTDTLDPMNQWTFYDGTLMTYFNWDTSEPDGGRGYLEMFTGYRWHDLGQTSSSLCLPICERR